MKRRLLSLILAAVMVCGLASTAAMAAESGGDYTIEGGVLVKYNGSGSVATVPEGITEIGERAFDGRRRLKEVQLPSSLRVIEAYAFCDTGLTEIHIPEGVETIGRAAFIYCGSLKLISIPASVTQIGSYAFESCQKLETIQVDAGNAAYCSVDGVLFSKAKDTLAHYPGGRESASYTIPDGVRAIGQGAFYNASHLLNLTIPSSMEEIAKLAFRTTGRDAPLSLYYTGTEEQWNAIAVENAENLDDCLIYYKDDPLPSIVTFPVEGGNISVDTSTGTVVGSDKEVTSVVIPENVSGCTVTGIATSVFKNCKSLQYVSLPASLTEIGNAAFQGCSQLTQIQFPDGLVRIGDNAFYHCEKLSSVAFPDSLKELGEMSFEKCSGLTRLTLPENLESVGHQAFYECSGLTFVALPENCDFSHGKRILSHCDNLSALYIPLSMTHMSGYEFDGSNIKDIFYEGTQSQWDAIRTVESCPPFSSSPTIHCGASQESFRSFVEANIIGGPLDSAEGPGAPDSSASGTPGTDSAASGNGEQESAEEAQARSIIQALMSQYPEGMHWDNDNYYRSAGLSSSGFGCAAFAYICSDAVFGDVPATEFHSDFDRIRVADILRIDNDTHSVVVLQKKADSVIVAEGNYNSSIHWGREISRAKLEQGGLEVTTRWSAKTPEESAEPTAYASTQKVQVDGRSVTFYAYALKDANGNDTNYVKLRDVADILNGSPAQFQVGWDGSICITTRTAYTPNGTENIQNFAGDQAYAVSASPVKVNGVTADLEAITLTDASGGGYTYFKLRDLGAALGFNVGWANGTGIFVETNRAYDIND